MTKKISIAIDAMGGDNSPDKTIEGVKFFLKKRKLNNDFVLNIFGRESEINEKLIKYKIKSDKINIINTNNTVSGDEIPLTAIKNSKNTSMWNCIQHQLEGKSDISLSAGNTGVLLVISRMILKMMNEVSKPALAGLWPNQHGMNVVLDLGANIECNDQNLVDFAELGSALYKSLFPKEKPKVSLLNVGSEEIKGTEMLKSASKKLKELSSDENFIYRFVLITNKNEFDTFSESFKRILNSFKKVSTNKQLSDLTPPKIRILRNSQDKNFFTSIREKISLQTKYSTEIFKIINDYENKPEEKRKIKLIY